MVLEEVVNVEVAPEAEAELEEEPEPEPVVHEEGMWHVYSFFLPYTFSPETRATECAGQPSSQIKLLKNLAHLATALLLQAKYHLFISAYLN